MTETKTISFGYTPRKWQHNCHINKKRFSVYAVHRRAGKTELALMELLDKTLSFSEELGVFVYIAPFLKQAKAIAWNRLKFKLKEFIKYNSIIINESDLSVVFNHNNAVLRLFGADNPDALRGLRIDGVVIDEISNIKPLVWNDILQPALSDRNGWALFIGTPAGTNIFSELFFKGIELPDWHVIKYTVNDTDSLDPNEIERLQRDMPVNSFAREYLCDFTASHENQLISLTDIYTASKRRYIASDFIEAPRIIGIDPARFGKDRSVIIIRQGVMVYQPLVFHDIDNMSLAAKVAEQINLHKPDATFIDSGYGFGIIDRLQQLNYNVIEINFGGKAQNKSQFLNMRSEMWWRMKEWIEDKGFLPNNTNLFQELSTPIYNFNASQQIILESKDSIKKRLINNASPDLADALAITFAYPVHKKWNSDKYVKSNKQRSRRLEFDPYKK